jgi:hypothetical protein
MTGYVRLATMTDGTVCEPVVAASVAAVAVGDAVYFGVPRGTAREAGCPAPAY